MEHLEFHSSKFYFKRMQGRELTFFILGKLDGLVGEVGRRIEEFYRQIPLEVRGHLDRLKRVTYPQPTEPGPITDAEKKRIMEDVERFFKKRREGG
ncbi:MAG: hypothetical protein E3J55_03700 [Dehalococcoidia bacterium]|nr:MAG: hypothetical protein E3J55_03700 [Dehalococcoidia bacterium]